MLIGCLSLLPLLYLQSGLTMNRSLAAMFSADDPALLNYQRLQSRFGGNLVVMLVYDDDQLMTSEGLARSEMWSTRVEQIAGVEGVLSVSKLATAFQYLRPSLSFSKPRVEPADIPAFCRDERIAKQFRDLFIGYTHSPDNQTAAIVVMLKPDGDNSNGKIGETIAELRQVASEMPLELHPMLVGEPVLLEDAFDLIESDGRRLAIGTIGLLCFVILLTLRDLRVVLLSTLCIVWSTVTTRALMVLVGMELSLVSTILLAIISVVAVAAIMHIAVRVRQRETTLVGAIGFLSIPILGTCLTDAAGFASLMVSDVRPVAEFGLMTATAALSVLVSLMLFSPWVMNLPDWFRFDKNHLTRREPSSHTPPSAVQRLLHRIASTSVRYHRGLLVASVLILLVSALYVSQLQTNASFLDNFRSYSPIVRSYERVESRLGGAGVWDVVLPAPDVISEEYLHRVRLLETQLRDLKISVPSSDRAQMQTVSLRRVLSLADADAVARQVTLLSFVSPEVRLAGMRAAIPAFADALLTFDDANTQSQPRQLRIMLRSDETLSGREKEALMSAVQQTVASVSLGVMNDDQSREPAHGGFVTGYSVLMSSLVASLVRDQWTALMVALVAVGLLLWALTRNLLLTLAALLVNTLPILVVLSLMGLLGGQLDLGSAMIGAVSIGLSIDGSIHFLSSYQRRLLGGEAATDAATSAAADLGTPILLASGALVIGFAVLVSSPFVPTATFGLLVAATLGLSAITNLTLLPALAYRCLKT